MKMKRKGIMRIISLLLVLIIAISVPISASAASSTGTGTATIGFSAGSLVLSSVPSFNFGAANVIPNTATSITAQNVSSNLLVLDDRGSGAGWRVTAQLGAFSNASYSGSDAIMPTAQLQLPSPAITAYNGNTAAAPLANTSVNLLPDEASPHTIVSAAIGQGNGGWQGVYVASSVNLQINPDNIVAGSNVANITWTLYDAP